MNIYQQFKNKSGKVYQIYKEIIKFFDKVNEHHLFMLAAGIAFNIIIYLIPLFLIAIYIINLIFSVDDIAGTLKQLSAELLPPTEQTDRVLKTILAEVNNIVDNSQIFGIIGFFVLLWISSTLISSFRLALNTIFDLKSKQFFLFYRMKDIGLTILLTILILIYSYIIPIVTFVSGRIQSFLPDFFQTALSSILIVAISVISSGILFYFVYSFVPNKKLERRVRWTSTIVCTISIELSRHIFAWYLGSVSNYGKFYGTYAIIVSIAIWIYYSALIILLSAEGSKFWNDYKNSQNTILKK